jgi:butyryl-CoA dehydrogenase
MKRELEALPATDSSVKIAQSAALEGVALLSEATQALSKSLSSTPDRALAIAVPFLKLCGFVMSGWLMAKAAALAASKLSGADRNFYAAKLQSARFYAEQVLPSALAQARVVTSGAASVTEADAALI